MEDKGRILVIDDELGIREGCKRILESEGYLVEGAESGVVGLEMVEKDSFDLILVDLMMPGIGGIEVIDQIHKGDPEIILVVITGYAAIETAVEATKRGAYDYIPKPFTPEVLSAVVKRGLEMRVLKLETQRYQLERERRLLQLAGERSRLRTVIGCMADGVLVTNRQGELVLWNAAATKMLDLKGKEKPGQLLSLYVENKAIVQLFKEVLASEEEGFSMKSQELQMEDEKVLMANVAPVKDEKGEILGAVTVFRDITQLKEVDRIKSQFISMVAHELRAPLAAIEGWLETVLTGAAGEDPERDRRWLGRAKERAHSLLELVNDLLVISRMERGKIAQKMEPIKIGELIEKIVDFFTEEAEKQGVSLEMKFPKDLPTIPADRSDMERLFTNLLDNAIKYNHKGGLVTLKAWADKNGLSVKVVDTGIGISKDDLPHIFDDFFRAEDLKTKEVRGTGLGLTIAKKIVDSHFGRIKVESQPKRGSTFVVWLPRQATVGEAAEG